MAARKKTAPKIVEQPVQEEIVIAYKGFDASLKCRNFQYEIGATYHHDGRVEVCNSGFHACEGPFDVFRYYPPGISRFALVGVSGALSRDDVDSKIAAAKITISAELNLPDFIQAGIKWLADRATNKGMHATGDRSAASSIGDRSAASSIGYQSAASSIGYQSAASSTGDQSAASSTGYQSAASSTGYQSAASSTGDRSAASSIGDRSAASSTGDQSAASSTGDQSAASSIGYQSAASSTGYQSAAMSSGAQGRVMGKDGCALFLVYRDLKTYKILHAWAGIAGRNGVKPMVWYSLDADGQPVEVA